MCPPDDAPELSTDRKEYNGRVRELSMSPLWDQYHGLLTYEPEVKSVPVIWHYADVRDSMLEAGTLITAKEAERRVLMLENPSYPGEAKATETLFTGLQLIMPGEVAPAHRHSPNALRLVLEGEGAYTSVSGEKTFMEYGDFIITPSWSWHDHGHEGTEPVIWQDILDLPFIGSVGTKFYEKYPDEQFPAGPPAGDSLRRYGSNMIPAAGLEPANLSSPIFSYPFAKSRETMEALAKNSELDIYHGLKMEFIDPTSGGPAMASISTYLQRLPKGFKAERYQSTESKIFTCLEGSGRAIIGDGDDAQTFKFSQRDIFVIPGWHPYRLEADEDSYLFLGSDKIIQEKFGLYRERRGNA